MNKLTPEEAKFLKNLAKTMATQNNRSTQSVAFVVEHEVKQYTNYHGDWSHKGRKDDHYGEFCHNCQKELDKDGDIPEECDDCDDDCFYYYNWVNEFDLTPGVFLTAEACDTHIKQNHYHYSDNAHSYGISNWRNPEMQKVMYLLIKMFHKDSPPNHYLP